MGICWHRIINQATAQLLSNKLHGRKIGRHQPEQQRHIHSNPFFYSSAIIISLYDKQIFFDFGVEHEKSDSFDFGNGKYVRPIWLTPFGWHSMYIISHTHLSFNSESWSVFIFGPDQHGPTHTQITQIYYSESSHSRVEHRKKNYWRREENFNGCRIHYKFQCNMIEAKWKALIMCWLLAVWIQYEFSHTHTHVHTMTAALRHAAVLMANGTGDLHLKPKDKLIIQRN